MPVLDLLNHSSSYHLFGCLSERAYHILLRLDLLGIALLIFGRSAPGVSGLGSTNQSISPLTY